MFFDTSVFAVFFSITEILFLADLIFAIFFTPLSQNIFNYYNLFPSINQEKTVYYQGIFAKILLKRRTDRCGDSYR